MNTPSGDGGSPEVTLGGLTAVVQSSWTDTLMLAEVPPGLSPGTVDAQITTTDGSTATLPNAFEVTF